MVYEPTLTDYVRVIISLFELFKQHRHEEGRAKLDHPFTYAEEGFIIFFMIMQGSTSIDSW